MGNLRKDYVLEKFVILPYQMDNTTASADVQSGCPFCPGNELLTERATLALVAKDGILKRLSDTE
ncbi:MAG: galactose-1-phosphate uridylyltransferase, partial [Nitrososphaeraceae archaeon]